MRQNWPPEDPREGGMLPKYLTPPRCGTFWVFWCGKGKFEFWRVVKSHQRRLSGVSRPPVKTTHNTQRDQCCDFSETRTPVLVRFWHFGSFPPFIVPSPTHFIHHIKYCKMTNSINSMKPHNTPSNWMIFPQLVENLLSFFLNTKNGKKCAILITKCPPFFNHKNAQHLFPPHCITIMLKLTPMAWFNHHKTDLPAQISPTKMIPWPSHRDHNNQSTNTTTPIS